MGNCASTGKHRFSASPDDIAVEMSSTQAAKEPPLCMIHGLMGCTMRKTGALAFIPVRAALGLPTPSLALPTKWEADVQASDGAVIGEPLTQIGCCGCVLHDQYGEFMDAFAKRRQEHFSYDWRRELGESAKRLEAHLEAMVQKYDAPVQCVAHSMGCMLLLAVMHRRPELIHSAIFAGGTFAGGIGYHFLLARGERIGLNGTLVAPETVATWPCAYATASPVGDPLLIGDDGTPHWQVLDKAKLKKGEAAPIEIDWYDIETWERLGLGVFGHGEKPSDEMRAHVATALRLGKQFQGEMRAVRNDPRDYPPCATLIGHGYQGEDFFLWDAEACTMKEVWRGDGLYVHKSSGPPPLEGAPPPCETDGLLPYFCSTLPPGVPHSKHRARHNGPAQKCGHMDLIDEVEQIDEILQELTAEASQRNKGMAKLPSTLKRHQTALTSLVSLTRRGGRQRASLLRNSIM